MGSTQSTMRPHNDAADLTYVDDLAERRRIQNRIAQRNYRKKLKRRLEDIERRAGTEAFGDGVTQRSKFWIKPKPGLTATFPTITSKTISRDHTRGECSRQAALLAEFDRTKHRRQPNIVGGLNKTNTSVPAAPMSTYRSAYGTEKLSDSVTSFYSAVAGRLGTETEIMDEELSDKMTDRGKKGGDRIAKEANARRGNDGSSLSEERSAQTYLRHPNTYDIDGTKYGTSSMPIAKEKQHLGKNRFAESMKSANPKERQRLISQALRDLSKGFTPNRPRKS